MSLVLITCWSIKQWYYKENFDEQVNWQGVKTSLKHKIVFWHFTHL